MRKFVIGLLSALAISGPLMFVSPVRGENFSELTFAAGMAKALQEFSNFESDKALAILNHLNQRPNLAASERELLSLMRLTIYRQTGNSYVNVPGLNEQAIEYLTEAIVIEDTSDLVRRSRGFAYCVAGNFEACTRDYAAAWKLAEDKSSESLASHLASRALAYHKIGKIQEGNADYRESARLYRLLGNEDRARTNEFFIRPE